MNKTSVDTYINEKKFKCLNEYSFMGDLMNEPVLVQVVAHVHNEKNMFVNVLETLPVHTFRGGSFKRDVMKAHDELKEALEAHRQIVDARHK